MKLSAEMFASQYSDKLAAEHTLDIIRENKPAETTLATPSAAPPAAPAIVQNIPPPVAPQNIFVYTPRRKANLVLEEHPVSFNPPKVIERPKTPLSVIGDDIKKNILKSSTNGRPKSRPEESFHFPASIYARYMRSHFSGFIYSNRNLVKEDLSKIDPKEYLGKYAPIFVHKYVEEYRDPLLALYRSFSSGTDESDLGFITNSITSWFPKLFIKAFVRQKSGKFALGSTSKKD